MKIFRGLCFLLLGVGNGTAFGQMPQIQPQVLRKTELEGSVAVVEVAPRFVTTIRLRETVNSVVVGDPSEFQVEHSEREPKLVFVKALTTRPSESNLLISTANGHEVSLLLRNRGKNPSPEHAKVDFLVTYERAVGFFVEPKSIPFALVGETLPLTGSIVDSKSANSSNGAVGKPPGTGVGALSLIDPPPSAQSIPSGNSAETRSLDQLLEEQQRAALPVLYGEHLSEESESGDRVRTGVSRVIDGGQNVFVLFSAVNPTRHAILLMPPQVQLGGRATSGKIIRHSRWSTSEQLPVLDFRLSSRRLGPGERADGVLLFERPPYKQSHETLLLQVAESGSVDRPALAPIGFGVSSSREDHNGGRN
jgi:hypothetical protein